MTWHLKGNPFEVQRVALERAEERRGFNWFMEQGLGKTAVALNNFMELSKADVVSDLVVVCPNSLKSNWVDESKNWEADAEFRVWEDAKRWDESKKRKSERFHGNAHVFNYEALLAAGGDAIEELLTTRRCMLVLDESQRIKNPNSTITRRVLGHYSKYAKIKRCLSGTPMTNTVVDFWPQLRFAGALNGSNPISFKKRYGIEVPGFKGKGKLVGVKNEGELQEIIAEYGFRAAKKEWADLPEKLYRDPIKTMIPSVLKEHYTTMLEEFAVMVSDDTVVTTEAVAGQYLKLQQISSGFIYDGSSVHRLIPTPKLPKFRALMDVIEANGNNSKTLVFAHFKPSCQELIKVISEELDQPVAYIVGGMKTEELRQQKDSFNQAGGPRVMVLQLSAGKEGHTLLGDRDKDPCHTVCYYENNFNLGDRLQSEDRPHRYGQKNAVLYVDFSSSPIESHVIRAFQQKKELVDYLVDNRPRLMRED